jgi:hypothetical protein
LVYNAILDERTTKLCKTLDGTVKPIDDPFWEKFYPPNHHSCRSLATVVRSEFASLKELKPTPEEKVRKFLKELNTDKQLKREFQFRGHTAKTLYRIPFSVYQRAKKYNLLEQIFEFNVSTKRREEWIEEIVNAEIKPKTLKFKFRKHEKHFVEYWGVKIEDERALLKYIEEAKRNPDKVYAQFHSKGGSVAFNAMLFKNFGNKESPKWFLVVIEKGKVVTAYPIPQTPEDYIKTIEHEGVFKWKLFN